MKNLQQFISMEDHRPVDDGTADPVELGKKTSLVGVAEIKEEKSYGDIIKEAETKVSQSIFEGEKVLPDLEASFVLISDKNKKVVDLQDIEKAIEGDKGISQESAQWVQDATGDFFGHRLSVNHFTKMKSPVNYDNTRSFLRNKIAAEAAALGSAEKFFMDQLSKLVEGVLSTTFEQMLNELVGEAKQLSTTVSGMMGGQTPTTFSTVGFFKQKQFQKLQDVEVRDDFNVELQSNETNLPPRIKNLETAILSLAQCSKKHSIAGLVFSTVGEFLNCVGNGAVWNYIESTKTGLLPQIKVQFAKVNAALANVETQPEDLVVDIQKLHVMVEDAMAVPIVGLIFNRVTAPLIEFANTN